MRNLARTLVGAKLKDPLLSFFGVTTFGQPANADSNDLSALTKAGAAAGASRNPDAAFT